MTAVTAESYRRLSSTTTTRLPASAGGTVVILGIVGLGFSYSAGSWTNFSGSYAGAKGGFAGFMAALVAALWAYDGWNDLNQVAGEIRCPNPAKLA